MNKRCSNCIFWTHADGQRVRRAAKEDSVAECRARSPLALAGPDRVGKWPKTAGYQWCGDHKGEETRINGKFAPRVERLLLECNITTLEQVEQTTRNEFMAIKSFGEGCLAEIESYFHSRGLELK